MRTLTRDRWTEAEVLAFPPGEHNYFDRKAGPFLENREDIEKAISAFANSGGGQILIGVSNDGTLSGVDPLKGRTPTREWLEQVIPMSVAPALAEFRVHDVERSSPSLIPTNRSVIVVDIADSLLAPHQAQVQRTYFYREGGRSVPAPHFYLEALRQRLIGPVLRAKPDSIRVHRVYEHDNGIFVETRIVFHVTNSGNVVAYRWHVLVTDVAGPSAAATTPKNVYAFRYGTFPRRPTAGGVVIDNAILPSLTVETKHPFGFWLPLSRLNTHTVRSALENVFPPNLAIEYRAISEISAGQTMQTKFRDFMDLNAFSQKLSEWNIEPSQE